MRPEDLRVVEEELGFRVDLPLPDGASEYYIYQSQNLGNHMQLITVRTGCSCPAYRNFSGKWEPYNAGLGKTFEPGTLESMAFELMQQHKRDLLRQVRVA